jgi:hypothetical protein
MLKIRTLDTQKNNNIFTPKHIPFANSITNPLGVPTNEKINREIKIKIFYIKLQIIFATFAIRFYYIWAEIIQ